MYPVNMCAKFLVGWINKITSSEKLGNFQSAFHHGRRNFGFRLLKLLNDMLETSII